MSTNLTVKHVIETLVLHEVADRQCRTIQCGRSQVWPDSTSREIILRPWTSAGPSGKYSWGIIYGRRLSYSQLEIICLHLSFSLTVSPFRCSGRSVLTESQKPAIVSKEALFASKTPISSKKATSTCIGPRNPRTIPTKSTINIASAKLGVVRILPFS